ncbi:MAG: 5'-nucleotidase SurE [Caldanaerobacter subterraneus]|jgi:5'-nucleotidase|uniref:5'-nucleotidase SurE n=3 Tax=Caldanaerobacter subterraneus TaxID=911092 RepID=SURE_CALS4|nr:MULTISPECIES: 5'/3'-nucleotidase SurE [Caldanaerobacter]Q8RA90.1 RecName: Full=5'-nucleotidase SurE; AltName: Full=Nucleoside 5'-monophosphate phosphohydrolase [Caldanaerobacter subterraneus subsp. tengcongensis MB4]AAM24560.1 Survival protein, predicted acid phosphatase [Caldanaerobacter subterraneus subsp. tengcongensis MB4]KKC29709.1 survival protein, acid phosphatase [Caldanaerobacter subterraneus subsp. pacificus DSM 12653]KUK09679.1 MAG: 5'-nucleotidase SurE [Caldanaerobacter subterran
MGKTSVLLTNDDGVQAKGILYLAEYLKENGFDVVVVAPEKERSAISHAITLHKPLRLKPVREEENLRIYAINGTPSDCVKMGIEVVMEKNPDIIISGINNGLNMGTDILYSGTVSAAIEGALYGIPALAVSLEEDGDFEEQRMYIFLKKLIEKVLEEGLPKNTLLNVNIPDFRKGINGIRITILGKRIYTETFQKNYDPRGKEYYWMAGKISEIDNDERTDIVSVKKGYISITPIHFDLTDYEAVKKLSSWKIDI